MKTDPMPRSPNQLPAVPAYFKGDFDESDKKSIQSQADRYTAMDDIERAESVSDVEDNIREAFVSRGLTPDKIDEIIEGLRTGSDLSQLEVDERAGLSDDVIDDRYEKDPRYGSKPSELLSSLIYPSAVMCAEQFKELAPDVQALYIFAIRSDVTRRMVGGSSYSEVTMYGRLPDDVVEQEAELFTAIVNSETGNITESDIFQEAAQNPQFMLDCVTPQPAMLPVDIRNICATNYDELGDILYKRAVKIQVEYLQAAVDHLRSVAA